MVRTFAGLGVSLVLAAGVAGASQNPGEMGKEMRGKIVRVDADKGVIVIRVGEGDKARNEEYRVGKTTRYFNNDRKPLTDGLCSRDFRTGTDVWFRLDREGSRNLTELRLSPTLDSQRRDQSPILAAREGAITPPGEPGA